VAAPKVYLVPKKDVALEYKQYNNSEVRNVSSLPKWVLSKIDIFHRSFLWRGEDLDKVRGGHRLVKWRTCTRPRKLGGLEIKDLEKFS
jgi:hypothetical protein